MYLLWGAHTTPRQDNKNIFLTPPHPPTLVSITFMAPLLHKDVQKRITLRTQTCSIQASGILPIYFIETAVGSRKKYWVLGGTWVYSPQCNDLVAKSVCHARKPLKTIFDSYDVVPQ